MSRGFQTPVDLGCPETGDAKGFGLPRDMEWQSSACPELWDTQRFGMPTYSRWQSLNGPEDAQGFGVAELRGPRTRTKMELGHINPP